MTAPITMPTNALQKAIFAALTGDADLVAALGSGQRVFDFVPQNQVFPFIRLDSFDVDERGAEDIDGFSVVGNLHIWSRPDTRGKKELHDLMDHVYRILHRANLSMTGFTTVSLMFSNVRTMVDPDAVTLHGIQQFRALLSKT